MLHHPFVEYTDLLSFDNRVYDSFTDAFQACQRSHIYLEDFYTDLQHEDSDSDDSSDKEVSVEDDTPLDDFEAFACQRY
jgi:hypothetical protein